MQILKRGRVFAQLSAVPAQGNRLPVPKPDIMAQLREVWGDRVFSAEEVRAMREAELAGEEG